VMPCTVVVGY